MFFNPIYIIHGQLYSALTITSIIVLQTIHACANDISHIDIYKTHQGRKKDILHVLTKHYEEHHKKESTSYYHNMLCEAIVHPDMKTVIPFAPEPILKTDGAKKDDCEHNAAERFLADFRREHPHLKIIAVQDSIAANYPNLNTIKQANMNFIV